MESSLKLHFPPPHLLRPNRSLSDGRTPSRSSRLFLLQLGGGGGGERRGRAGGRGGEGGWLLLEGEEKRCKMENVGGDTREHRGVQKEERWEDEKRRKKGRGHE